MYRRVLVCLDGSPFAEKALPTAVGLCREWEAELTLFRAVKAPAPLSLGPLPSGVVDQPLQAQIQRSQEELERLATRFTEDLTVHCDVRLGTPIQALREAVSEYGIELIVLATHQRHGLARWLLGSTSGNLLYRTECPVLSLPFSAEPQAPSSQ